MRKKIGYSFLILYYLFRCISSLNAQTSEFKWAKWAGGISEDYSCSISLDKFGNTVITGYFNDIAYFWPYSLITDGSRDIFVTKYDESGNVTWANRVGGKGVGYCVTIDKSGNSIISGSSSKITFGGSDIFIAKYDASGNLLWEKGFGGVEADYGWGIGTDIFGNICITGCFRTTINFGSISLTSVGDYDVFIAKFDSSGNTLWAKSGGGPNSDIGYSIASDKLNNYFITGVFSGIATFDKTTIQGNGIFIAKYGSDGNLIWVKEAIGTSTFSANSIAIDNSNNPIITGNFRDILSFGLDNLHSSGDNDIFIAKYDALGNILWAKRAGGAASDAAHDISTDYFGNPIITGSFRSSSNFGSYTLNSLDGSPDIFIAKFNTNGDVEWAKQAGGKGYDAALSIVSDKNGTNTITGFFEGTSSFDKININSAGDRDIFVAQFEEKANFPDSIPTAPKNLVANAGDKKVILSWSPNPEPDLSYYKIYRNQSQNVIPIDFDSLAIVFKPDSSYVDHDVTNGLTYYYVISAVDLSGNESNFSEMVNATPQAGTGSADIALSANSHDFGAVPVFSTSSWQLIIENNGSANLVINHIESNNPVFTVTVRQFSIAPQNKYQLEIQFQPDSLQSEQGILTINSNDPDQPELSVTLTGKGIDNQAPEISLQTPAQAMWINSDFQLSAQIVDNWAIGSATLHYRKGSDMNFQGTAMSQGANHSFSGIIPASAMTFAGLAYFIKAEDSSGNTTSSDTLSHEIYFLDNALKTSSLPCPYQSGYPRGEWFMISVPAVLEQASVSAVLMDETELGNYGEPNWRLFCYQDTDGDNVTDSYLEFRSDLESSVFRFDGGKAFWLKANPAGNPIEIDVGAGHVLPLEPKTIQLNPGWNQIGNPFAFPIAFSPSEEQVVDQLYLPDGSGGYRLTKTMQPWAGYFVFVNGTESVNMALAPKSGSLLEKPFENETEWKIQICASCGANKDEINYIGINELSCDEWDGKDYPEPPGIGDYISIYFPHRNWSPTCENYTTDFRGEIGDGQVWDFNVWTNINTSDIILTWHIIKNIDTDLQISLYDRNRNEIVNMKEHDEYIFSRMNQETLSYFQIFVGNKNFVDRQIEEKRSQLPERFGLSQNYPNPFNSTTSIQFQVAAPQKISLKIIDLLGREVRTLINEYKPAGYFQVSWDGKDNRGMEVVTGIYLCIFQAGQYFESRKVLVLK